MTRRSCFGWLFTALLSSAESNADWVPLGPPTDRVNVLQFDPHNAQIVFAGTSCGLFKSTDGGSTWFTSNRGAPYAYVRSLVADPRHAQRLWMSLSIVNAGLGIYRSRDAGATWEFASQGLADLEVNGFAVHPLHPDTVLASTQSSGIYRSLDGGDTWNLLGLGAMSVGGVAFHPTAPETVYAGVKNDVPWRSTDGGLSWNPAGNGYPQQGFRFFLAVVPVLENGGWLYTCGPDAHRSTDASSSWSALTNGIALSHYFRSLAVAWPASATAPIVFLPDLHGAVYRSLDGGETFTDVAPAPPPGPAPEYEAVAMAPGGSPQVMIGGVGGELYRSNDRGDHWETSARGMIQGFAYAVAARGDTVLTGMLRGIWVSYDRGTNWIPSDLVADYGARTWRIAIDPRGSAVAATTDFTGAGHVMRASGDLAHWVSIHTMSGPAYAVALDPDHPDTLYAGSGASLVPGKIAVSHDGGQEWSEAELAGADITVAYAPPGGNGVAYAGTTGGLFLTTDAGVTWSRSGLAGLFVQDVVAHPENRQVLFAATRFQGVWRSDDGGSTWRPWNAGLTDSNVNALAIAADFPWVIYAGTAAQGVFARDTDGSLDWRLYDEPSQPPVREIRDLEPLEGSEPAIVAATYGMSVWVAPELRVPVDVQNFEAASGRGRVLLTWELSSAARRVVRGVSVQRSPTSDGPYVECTAEPLEPRARMSFEDPDVEPFTTVWYRLRLWTVDGLPWDTPALQVESAVDPARRMALRTPVESSAGGPILLRYSLSTRARVRLAIFDVSGAEIRVVEQGWAAPGDYTRSWDRRTAAGARVVRGVYLVRLEASGASLSRKFVLLHR